MILAELERDQRAQQSVGITTLALFAHIATKLCCLITVTCLLLSIWAFSAYPLRHSFFLIINCKAIFSLKI
jgi:hypothetical protein